MKSWTNKSIDIYATGGTHKYFKEQGLETHLIPGVSKNSKKDGIIKFLKENKVSYVINTPGNLAKAAQDAQNIRTVALLNGVTSITSIRLAKRIASLTEQMRFLIKPSY